jgi:hypothetical protein
MSAPAVMTSRKTSGPRRPDIGAPAQDLDQLHAVHAGQHQVDEIEVEGEGLGGGQQRIAVVEAADRDALLLQELRQEFRVLGVVVDQGEGLGLHGGGGHGSNRGVCRMTEASGGMSRLAACRFPRTWRP